MKRPELLVVTDSSCDDDSLFIAGSVKLDFIITLASAKECAGLEERADVIFDRTRAYSDVQARWTEHGYRVFNKAHDEDLAQHALDPIVAHYYKGKFAYAFDSHATPSAVSFPQEICTTRPVVAYGMHGHEHRIARADFPILYAESKLRNRMIGYIRAGLKQLINQRDELLQQPRTQLLR